MSRSMTMFDRVGAPRGERSADQGGDDEPQRGQPLLGQHHRRQRGDEQQLDDARLREGDEPPEPGVGLACRPVAPRHQAARCQRRGHERAAADGHSSPIVRLPGEGDQPDVGLGGRQVGSGCILLPVGDNGGVPPTSTAPVEVDEPTSDVDVVPDMPWVVIVWNDPINLMSYVTYVLQKLFGYAKEKAESLMSTSTTRAGPWSRTAPGRRPSSTSSASTSTACGPRCSRTSDSAGGRQADAAHPAGGAIKLRLPERNTRCCATVAAAARAADDRLADDRDPPPVPDRLRRGCRGRRRVRGVHARRADHVAAGRAGDHRDDARRTRPDRGAGRRVAAVDQQRAAGAWAPSSTSPRSSTSRPCRTTTPRSKASSSTATSRCCWTSWCPPSSA